ncbi:hypothetical protein KEM55_008184 [Ascosphaera atra]|nr:hypothetical protein KEM55_008184 [Ascosphaera atra]
MAFPEPRVLPARREHTHTIIFLHGRGGDGDEMLSCVFGMKDSASRILPFYHPGCRWVFPTAPPRYHSQLQLHLNSWFTMLEQGPYEADHNPAISMSDLRESMMYMTALLRREVQLLDGKMERIVLGGLSQGMVAALWTVVCAAGLLQPSGLGRLGGVIGLSGWLPEVDAIETTKQTIIEAHPELDNDAKQRLFREAIPPLLAEKLSLEGYVSTPERTEAMLSTPVLLLHDTYDCWLPASLSRRANKVLNELGMDVERKEYEGAENSGHWIKEPESFDAMRIFLDRVWGADD